MDDYGPATYGDAIADLYDELMTNDPAAAVEFLAELAPEGDALELGIGTGRVALPLAARGLRVHGIEASERMVAQLRAKPGGADLAVTVGDFADVEVPGAYDLIFVVFNTLFWLTSQQEQLRCLTNAAAKLRTDGRLVVEALVPNPALFDRNQRVQVEHVGAREVRLSVWRHDPVAQTTAAQRVFITESGLKLIPMRLRYAWPSELDLMCRLAGLRLVHRFGGWNREPFTAASGLHVSVYAGSPA